MNWKRKLVGLVLLVGVLALIRWYDPLWIASGSTNLFGSLSFESKLIVGAIVALAAVLLCGNFVFNLALLLLLIWLLPDINYEPLNETIYNGITFFGQSGKRAAETYMAIRKGLSFGVYGICALFIAYLLNKLTSRNGRATATA